MIFWPLTIPAALFVSVFVPLFAFCLWVWGDEEAYDSKSLWEQLTSEGRGYWKTTKPLFLP